jgi:glycosyltransferase involved in cell wall biosynthesis
VILAQPKARRRRSLDQPTLSVVIPVLNGAQYLDACLTAVLNSGQPLADLIVVDDGSTDGSADLARSYGARIIRLGKNAGPARARNVGARETRGEILVFLDADVEVHPDTLERIYRRFVSEPELDALMGSYDDEPTDPGLVSQYRNLLHCHTHHVSSRKASTFWAGCGAVRRHVFWAHKGFDETRRWMEDVELGLRMAESGCRMDLDPSVQVRHQKRWSLRSMIRTDILARAIPWTLLILQRHRLPNELNLRWSQRLSVITAWLLLLSVGAWAWVESSLPLIVCVAGYLTLNLRLFRFLASRGGLLFAVRSLPLHLLHHSYCGIAFVAGTLLHARSRLQAWARR